MSNFNYCPLVWMFSNTTSLKKIENLKKRALIFLYNNYQLTYEELLNNAKSSTMNVKKLRFLCVEIYKTISNLNPGFIKIKSRLVKGVWEYLDRKFGTVYHNTLNLQKILKLWKLLSKTGTVLIASAWFVKSYKPYFYLFSPFFYSLLQ